MLLLSLLSLLRSGVTIFWLRIDIPIECTGLTYAPIFLAALNLNCCCWLVPQSCPPLCISMDCSPPGSSIHGISQAKLLEWLSFPSPRDLPKLGIKPASPALAGRFFTTEYISINVTNFIPLNIETAENTYTPDIQFLPSVMSHSLDPM